MKHSKTAITLLLLYPVLYACVATGGNSALPEAIIEPPSRDEIVFETDFSNDLGFYATNEGLINQKKVPSGWNGVKVSGEGVIEVVTDPVTLKKPILKISWDPNLAQPVASLYKHLTGQISSGYDELFIRYNVRLPNNFKAGNGKLLNHWKWGRLWQNSAPQHLGSKKPGPWHENRRDSYYVVWNFNGSYPYTDINAAWGSNTGANLSKGSAGGERYVVDYFVSGSIPETQPGYFESVGEGHWDFINSNEDPVNAGFLKDRDQKWHTLEFHFKLASSAVSNDAIFEVYFDGIKQIGDGIGGNQGWTRLLPQGGASPTKGIPTARNGGSGFNLFSLFDNLVSWNSDWGDPDVEGYIFINDVVISKSRIGHKYSVNSL